jgi:hypothetical protein
MVMRELKIVDVDQSTLIVAHPDGEEFRVPVDGSMMNRLRGKRSERCPLDILFWFIALALQAGLGKRPVLRP